MIPGEIFPAKGILILNEGAISQTLMVENKGDRPVQVGSHYHFGEANSALKFDKKKRLACVWILWLKQLFVLNLVNGVKFNWFQFQGNAAFMALIKRLWESCKCQLKLRDLNILQCLGQP